MSDNEKRKEYGTGMTNGSGSHIPGTEDIEKDFADLLSRISGKVKDLQSEIDDHDQLRRGNKNE